MLQPLIGDCEFELGSVCRYALVFLLAGDPPLLDWWFRRRGVVAVCFGGQRFFEWCPYAVAPLSVRVYTWVVAEGVVLSGVIGELEVWFVSLVLCGRGG